jgi:hypothetical protein
MGGGKILEVTIKGGCYNKVSLQCIQLSGENREGVGKCHGGGESDKSQATIKRGHEKTVIRNSMYRPYREL